MVAAGRHGRKAGHGYYDYEDGDHRPDDPEPAASSEATWGFADTDEIDGPDFRAVSLLADWAICSFSAVTSRPWRLACSRRTLAVSSRAAILTFSSRNVR